MPKIFFDQIGWAKQPPPQQKRKLPRGYNGPCSTFHEVTIDVVQDFFIKHAL
jgi:hypothetical protein